MTNTCTDEIRHFVSEHAIYNLPWFDEGLDARIELPSGAVLSLYNDDGTSRDVSPSLSDFVRVGCSGYDLANKVANYGTLEFDCGHSANSLSSEEIREIADRLSPHCDLIWSTGGKGLHGRIRFDKPIPCSNRSEYRRICEAAIRYLESEAGFEFATKVEKAGSILWLGSINQAENSFTAAGEQQAFFAIPSDVVQGLMEPVSVPGTVSLYAPLVPGVNPKVADALEFLDPDDWETWNNEVGLALKNEGEQYRPLWIDWSKRSDKSNGLDLELAWDKLAPNGSKTLGSVFYLARQAGWTGSPSVVANSVGVGDDRRPVPINQIIADIEAAGLMPNRISDELFVEDGGKLRFIKDKDDLFVWLKSRTQVDWCSVRNGVTGQELYRQLQSVATEFRAISELPHQPRVPEIYYLAGDYQPGNKFEEYLDFFCPESPQDRQLLKAKTLTHFWGGPPGLRPNFNIVADGGRGSGKTAAAEADAHLVGGCVKVFDTDTGKLTTRLLSPSARGKRIILLDNLKGRFDWDGAEQLITAPTISGHRMYSGEGQLPNLFTWLITVNGIDLSTDMAQRAVIIKLARPENDPNWWPRLLAFIDEHRNAIIGDILATLQGPRNPIGPCSRWATWEGEVLALLDNPQELQQLILERQGQADSEAEDARAIEAAIVEAIENAGGDADLCYRLSNQDVAKVYNSTLDTRLAKSRVTVAIKQAIGEGQITRLVIDPSRKHGRCYLWNRRDADDIASNELLNRLLPEPRFI